MRFANSVVFFLLLSCCLHNVESEEAVTTVLEVKNGGKWGEWGRGSVCPEGKATGFSLKVQPTQGLFSDDTSLNGIRLVCTDGSVVTSAVGKEGAWSDASFCKSGFLTSFSLRVSDPKLIRDDTAANNIRFKCTDGTELEGNGQAWGEYGAWSESCTEGGICGIQTKVETSAVLDDTGLNDVKFFCCS